MRSSHRLFVEPTPTSCLSPGAPRAVIRGDDVRVGYRRGATAGNTRTVPSGAYAEPGARMPASGPATGTTAALGPPPMGRPFVPMLPARAPGCVHTPAIGAAHSGSCVPTRAHDQLIA